MINQVLMRTETAPMIMLKNPAGFARELSSALDKSVEKYGAQWDAKMIEAYQTALTADQIKIDCAAINARDRTTVINYSMKVSGHQRALSEQLLVDATTDTMNRIMPLLH